MIDNRCDIHNKIIVWPLTLGYSSTTQQDISLQYNQLSEWPIHEAHGYWVLPLSVPSWSVLERWWPMRSEGEKLLCCWTNGFETRVHKTLAGKASCHDSATNIEGLLCTCKINLLSRAASTFICCTSGGLSKCLFFPEGYGLPHAPSPEHIIELLFRLLFSFLFFSFSQLEKL